MRFEGPDRCVRADRYDHQRKEQIVPPRQLGDEEHARQRGMHHAGHGAGHAHQCKILFR